MIVIWHNVNLKLLLFYFTIQQLISYVLLAAVLYVR